MAYKIERGRPATLVHGFVLAVFRARAQSIRQLYHSILVNALLGRKFGNGLANGEKEHDPRVGERQFVGRNGRRVDAMQAKTTITSTVRHGGLCTSTIGAWWPAVGAPLERGVRPRCAAMAC